MAGTLLCSCGVRIHVTSVQEDGCDKGVHQSYLGTERNAHVIPNWFPPCQVLEVCDSFKLLSIYFDLCVDATGVVCHQLGLLGTDLHTIGFVEMLN